MLIVWKVTIDFCTNLKKIRLWIPFSMATGQEYIGNEIEAINKATAGIRNNNYDKSGDVSDAEPCLGSAFVSSLPASTREFIQTKQSSVFVWSQSSGLRVKMGFGRVVMKY